MFKLNLIQGIYRFLVHKDLQKQFSCCVKKKIDHEYFLKIFKI